MEYVLPILILFLMILIKRVGSRVEEKRDQKKPSAKTRSKPSIVFPFERKREISEKRETIKVPAFQKKQSLRDPGVLKRAVVLREILDRPVSLREGPLL